MHPCKRARVEWENWFAENVRFHWVAELCLDMKARRKYMIGKKHLYKTQYRIYW
jgi:hypothetical protein